MAMMLPHTTATPGWNSLREATSLEMEKLTDLPLTTKSQAKELFVRLQRM